MAYLASVSDPVVKHFGDGRKYVTWTVTETDVSPGDEWKIEGIPTPCELVLFECHRTDADLSTTVQPELGAGPEGAADAWTVGGRYEVAIAASADASQRIAADQNGNPIRIRGIAGAADLVGRSQVDDHANEVVTHVTVRVGG